MRAVAGAGRVTAPQPVENPVEVLGRDRRAAVGDGDSLGGARDLDPSAALGVLGGVWSKLLTTMRSFSRSSAGR